MFQKTIITSTIALLGLIPNAMAQIAPDAGQTLQQLAPPPSPPKEGTPILIESPLSSSTVPGGSEVELTAVAFTGNTIFSSDELTTMLADAIGKRHDLAGLRGIADRVLTLYRSRGYPFTQTFIPPQEFKDGTLHIQVLEGRYGVVQANGDASLVPGAQRFIDALSPSDLIKSSQLERTVLIIEDQPGIKATPSIQPGKEIGTGDLALLVERESRFGGEVGLDNAGNRYTGDIRGRMSLYANSPFTFGDRIAFSGMLTSENMWLGTLDYELPIGNSGLRAQVGYAHTAYALAKDFSYLKATGLARVATAKASYPLIRSQQTNLLVSLAYQEKTLQDTYDNTNTVENKSSQSWPLLLRFDNRDSFGGGGVTYGALTWTAGQLFLDNTLAASDRLTAKKQGVFNKWNLDVARIQKLPGAFSLYGRYSGQLTDKNLDSSERFGLGGANGVRAYPLGEGMGDSGWLTQIELRYAAGPVTPFAFYDAGNVEVNFRPWDVSSQSTRLLSGAGVGMRIDYQGWQLDLTMSWRINGGNPTSDTSTHEPRVWAMAAYRF